MINFLFAFTVFLLPISQLVAFSNSELSTLHEKGESGDLDSQIELAQYYQSKKNEKEFVKWIKKTADQGYMAGLEILGKYYLMQKNIPEGFKCLKKCAEDGEPFSQAFIGACYATGECVPINFKEAVRWYEKSANQGYSEGQFRLGLCYQEGKGVERDVNKAIRLYRQAALQDMDYAQCRLGTIYLMQPVPDYNEALYWFGKAAAHDNPLATFMLGNMYIKGQGVRVDIKKGKELLTKAATLDVREAECTLQALDIMENVSSGMYRTISVEVDKNNINIICDQDVVSFMMSPFNRDSCEQLKSLGYKGLKNISGHLVSSHIMNQNYIELIKHVRTEDDVNYAVNFLRPLAEQGHGILMIELCATLCNQMQLNNDLSKEKVLEAYKWLALGMTSIEMDSCCTNDKSTLEALSLQNIYNPDQFLPKSFLQNLNDTIIVNHMRKSLDELNLRIDAPSPKWIIFHGLEAMNGKNSLKPSSEWFIIKTKKLSEIKRSLTKILKNK